MAQVKNELERTNFTFSYTKSTGFYANIKDKRLNPIPSNTIIYKNLPGIGATTAEINEPRNSIIVLPNLPVIKGKQDKHALENKTFAVYEGVQHDELGKYLTRKDVLNRKILTTPESFLSQIKGIMEKLGIDMYNNYFLLFDEGHKYLLDNNYRGKIVLPFNDFFRFKNKAIISATPLRLSDPRFKEQRFINATINPIYDIKQDLKLVDTNNLAFALRKQIQVLNNEHYCIFYNSIDGIKSLIESLNILTESNIFCSAFSKRELEIQKYENVYSEFHKNVTLKKYNFFTSSFYNGLDIELKDIKPSLIILTSINYADHTAVDPYTDSIQIVGRIRKGVSNIVHITNTNDKIYYKTPQQIVEEFNTSGEVYKAIKTLKLAAPSPFAQKLYSEALERIFPYVNLLTKPLEELEVHHSLHPESGVANDPYIEEQEDEESIDYFKLDNYFYHHKVKAYYSDINNLIEAYEQTRAFNISHEICYCKVDKNDLLKRFGGRYTSTEVYRDITDILSEIEVLRTEEPFEYERQSKILDQQFPLIVRAFYKIGIDKMLSLNFNHRLIQLEVIKFDADKQLNSHPVIDAVYTMIGSTKKLPCERIKAMLLDIYSDFNINKIAKATDIKYFYNTEDVKVLVKKKWQRGYKFQEKKFNLHPGFQKP
jgi:hypothetical protein